MKSLFKLGMSVLFSAMFLGISGCTAIGAGVGGAAGAAASDGDPAATVGGAIVGGAIGHEM